MAANLTSQSAFIALTTSREDTFSKGEGRKELQSTNVGRNGSSRSYFCTNMRMSQAALSMFYLGFACYFLSMLLPQTTFETFLGIEVSYFCGLLQVLALGLFMTKVLLQNYRVRTLVLIGAVFLIMLLSSRVCGVSYLLWCWIVVASADGIDIRTLAKVLLAVVLPVFLLTAFCANIGIIESYYMNRDGMVGVRSSLGFTHPNQLGRIVMIICIAMLVLAYGGSWKVAVPAMAFTILGAYLVSDIADSRTAALSLMLADVIFIVCAIFKSRKRLLAGIGLFCLVLSIATSIVLMVGYDSSNSFLYQLNTLVSRRLGQMNGYYEYYGISVLGRSNFEAAGLTLATLASGSINYFVVDNAYAHLLLREGLLPTVVFLLATACIFVKAYRENCFNACLFGLIVFSIVGLVETYFFKMDSNIYLCALSALVYGRSIASLDPVMLCPSNAQQDAQRNDC